uniref:Histone deacetylase 12 n=1 Tax=Takifugu rubripes TaxID=31033 RepID=A0A674PET6_TAKRU
STRLSFTEGNVTSVFSLTWQVRHESCGLPIIHHSKYVCDLPTNHRFPMGKFPRVLHFLFKDQVITENQVWVPEIASSDLLSCVHTEEYLNNFMNGRINDEGIVTRCRYETGEVKNLLIILQPYEPLIPSPLFTGGTLLAAELALQRGLACSTAGGTHHAFPGFGSGFCLLNDLAVAAKYVSASLKRKVLIVDLDVHQGDGTAFIFKEEPRVFTFSVHCGKNFPLRKQQSDLDISVTSVEDHLPWLLDTFRPDLVLYDAGVDPHREDELGKLCLTDQGEPIIDLNLHSSISEFLVHPRAVSERSVRDNSI